MPDKVLVTGDIVVDHHIYEGERPRPELTGTRGVRVVREYGGAMCTVGIVRELFAAARRMCGMRAARGVQGAGAPEESWDVSCGRALPGNTAAANPVWAQDAYAVWRPFPASIRGDGPTKFWRASAIMGYGDRAEPLTLPRLLPRRESVARVLVLDDAGFMFRTRLNQRDWRLPAKDVRAPDWIVLKTASPLARGDLWQEVITRFPERLIVIASARDLRQACVRLTRGLSWESSVEDLRDELQRNHAISSLTRCRHLLITFAADGALWVDRAPTGTRATLIYDPRGCEGQWAAQFEGDAFGYLSCLVAAVVHELVHHIGSSKADTRQGTEKHEIAPDLTAAAAGGLAAVRRLRRDGHGEVGDRPPAGFPAATLAREILAPSAECLPLGGFARSGIPWTRPGAVKDRGRWMIIDSMQRATVMSRPKPLFGLAHRVVKEGAVALKDFPHAKFGDLTTADRSEIETLRGLRHLMDAYRRDTASKPLSIGVFGPPGAGKSFGVKQVALELFGKEAWLEFNLSQFEDAADLIGAFHEIRDVVLAGKTPVAFFDEFDSQNRRWIRYLLAPMQDGRFQEGNLSHASGKCIFVFAGGTSYTYDDFGRPPQGSAKAAEYRLLKVPDFHSRLDAYYDVLGPNPRLVNGQADPLDLSYPLRRGLFVRSKLGAKEAAVDFDPGLLNALLEVPRYTHGARSLEKLVMGLRTIGSRTIRRSALPPPHQLAMHVGRDDFVKLLERDNLFQTEDNLEKLARAIHEAWIAISRREGWPMRYDMPFDELPLEIREDNRAAAARIPEILALAGLRLAQGEAPARQEREVQAQLEHHLELLSEAEHVGWMMEKLRNGWRFAPERDDDKKLHHALVPYGQLTQRDQDKDRDAVRHFPEMVRLAKFHIEAIPGVSRATRPRQRRRVSKGR